MSHPLRRLRRARLLALACGFSVLPGSIVAQGSGARWTLTPELRIGSREREESALSRISGLAVGRDGKVYVAQPLDRAVWVFDARGKRLTNVGRRGNGPGEFQDPREIGWLGDTLWVHDAAQGRMTLFADAIHAALTITVGRDLYPLAPLADGSVLARENPSVAGVGTGRVSILTYYRLSRSGARLGPVARIDVQHGWMLVRNPAPGRDLPNTLRGQPFSDMRLVAVSASGREVVMVDRPSAPGPRAVFSVTHYDAAGRATWTSRIPYTPQRLTRELIDDSIAPQARMIAAIPDFGATERTVTGWIRDLLYIPRNLPPVSTVVAGRDGTVWLRREPARGGPAHWMVLGAGGRMLATLEAPSGLRIMDADAQHVWGVVKDDLDVPYVVVYRVRRGVPR
jgi:hypothetical protein